MEPVLTNALKFLHEAGLLGVLILVLFGGWKRWWVFGHQHERVIARFEQELTARTTERDEWKRVAMAQIAVVPPPSYPPERRTRSERRTGERRQGRDRRTPRPAEEGEHGAA
jgi:hypothetical protein